MAVNTNLLMLHFGFEIVIINIFNTILLKM